MSAAKAKHIRDTQMLHSENFWPGPPVMSGARNQVSDSLLMEDSISETETENDSTTEEELVARLNEKMTKKIMRHARDGARKLNKFKRCTGTRSRGRGGGKGGAGAGAKAW